jgi:chromate transporter
MNEASLIDLAVEFSILSVLSFGGMTSALTEIQRVVVEHHQWMDARTFADLYGLGYAMPGPNVLVVSLIGYHVAGIAGALVATLAMAGPSALLAMLVVSVWDRFQGARWRRVTQAGLFPVIVGLALSGGCLITVAAAHGPTAYLLTALTAVMVLKTRVSPLWLIALGAILGLSGIL